MGYKVPENTNAADLFIDLITLDTRTPEQYSESKERLEYLTQQWKIESADRRYVLVQKDPILLQKRVHNIFSEIFYISQRHYKETYRNKTYILLCYLKILYLLY